MISGKPGKITWLLLAVDEKPVPSICRSSLLLMSVRAVIFGAGRIVISASVALAPSDSAWSVSRMIAGVEASTSGTNQSNCVKAGDRSFSIRNQVARASSEYSTVSKSTDVLPQRMVVTLLDTSSLPFCGAKNTRDGPDVAARPCTLRSTFTEPWLESTKVLLMVPVCKLPLFTVGKNFTKTWVLLMPTCGAITNSLL